MLLGNASWPEVPFGAIGAVGGEDLMATVRNGRWPAFGATSGLIDTLRGVEFGNMLVQLDDEGGTGVQLRLLASIVAESRQNSPLR